VRNSLALLADRGLVQKGTLIELVPAICASHAAGSRGDRFRAEVVKPQGGPGALRWTVDGQCYSAQALLTKLIEEEGVGGVPIVFRNWRIVGHTESIWAEANSLEPGGVDDDSGETIPPSNNHLPDSRGSRECGGEGGKQRAWLREKVEQILIPVIIAVLTAAILAWLGLNK
jgi:hypothetical protein